ncbi:hypothetical protein LIER_10056 [Lithospermum erythrorhizon]|uniref:Uncharacterized protein n=1 Tax=Lithospermum erythrorhizon TaxID=34254 RepID=A0AAV3PHV4_LITER
MQFPFSSFVNNPLIPINRAPSQLTPIGRWLNLTMFQVACRIAMVEPRVCLFAALFSVTHDNFQTIFSTHRRRNILVKNRPNKVPNKRLLNKWFFPQGGMVVGVPRIWTLKSEEKSLPTDTDSDIVAIKKIRSTLPQDTDAMERLPWFTYVDEALPVAAGLVYDREFNFDANDEPTSWGINLYFFFMISLCFLTFNQYICCFAEELVLVASAAQPEEVNFDVMFGERSSLFDRMKLKSKTKPRKSMVPANFQPAAPIHITSIPAPKVNSMLNRIVENILASTSNPSKMAKMATLNKKKKSSK